MNTSWQVCYKGALSPSGPLWDTMFQETGLIVKIQTLLTSAMINVREPLAVKNIWDSSSSISNLGVRLTAPKADGILFLIPSRGLISFIAKELDCSSTGDGAENPMTFMAEQMYVDTNPEPFGSRDSTYFSLKSINLDAVIGASGVREVNMYQVCFSPPDADKFFATGISLRLHTALTQVIVNGVRPNFGLRVALPKSRSNILHFEGEAIIVPGEAGMVEKVYSFIQIGGDCSLASDNAVNQSSTVSGHMHSGAVAQSVFLVPVSETDRMRNQAPGLYQICYMRRKAEGVLFSDTGLTISVQDKIVRLQTNFIPKIRSAAPRFENNQMFFCTDEHCANLKPGGSSPSALLSFIGHNWECEDVLNANTLAPLPGRSGHIDTVSGQLRSHAHQVWPSLDSALSPAGTLQIGIYQVCYSASTRESENPIFRSTGLSLEVQEYLTQIFVGGATPGFGLRAAIPRIPGHTPELVFGSALFGDNSDQVSLIRDVLDCDDPKHNLRLPDEFSSGHLSSSGLTKILAGTQHVTSLQIGTYQACFKGRDGKFKTTGVSVTLQTWASSFLNLPQRSISLQAIVKKTSGNQLTFLSDATGPSAPTRASFIVGGSCTSDTSNPSEVGPMTSGYLSLMAGASQGEFNFDLPPEIDQSDILAELLYQFCVEIQGEWKNTGLTVQVEWSSVNNAPTVNFDFVSSQESSFLAGSSSAVHVLMKTGNVLPQGGILKISGLTGSQTKDSPFLQVEGNNVEEVTMEMICAGNFSCQVTTAPDYIDSGKILMRAELTIDVACTDLDSVCKQCPEGSADCSEGITLASISSTDVKRDFTASISRGPWTGCLNKCQETRRIIAGYDILDIATKNGKPFTTTIQTSQYTSFYTCSHGESLVSLKAYVKVSMLVSKLSQHLLTGSFSSSNGRLVVPHVPFDKNKYIHITFILRNSNRETRPRTPSASIVATRSGGVAVNEMNAVISPKTRPGILMSDKAIQFVYASLEMSSKYTAEINRFMVRLKTNSPAVIPRELQITIAGLVGSNQNDNAILPLLNPSDVEIRTFECVGGKHCLIDVDAKPSTAGVTFRRATLDLDIYCSDFGSYPSKYIESISACSQLPGQTSCPLLRKLVLDQRDYSRGPWQECSGCSFSTRRVMRGYDLSRIIETYDKYLLKRFALEVSASKDVSDLKCPYSSNAAGSTSVLAVKAILTVRIEYFRASASWSKLPGELTVSMTRAPSISKCGSSDPLSCLPDITFAFELKNPNFPTSGPVYPVVSASGGGLVWAPLKLPAIFHIVGPRNQFEVIEAFIKESTRIKGNLFSDQNQGLNTLTLRLQIDRPLPAGTLITVGGLQGTQTPSKPCNPVQEPRCGTSDCIYSPANQMCQNGIQLKNSKLGANFASAWDQATGTLRFMIMKSFAQINELEFSFQLHNAASAQTAKVATVSGAGDGFVIRSTPVMGTVLSSGLDKESAIPTQPIVESAIIAETSKLEYETNTLIATMKFNVPLAAGSLIRISKLDNTFVPPSRGTTWYSDDLPQAKLLNVQANSDRIRNVGQYNSLRSYHVPWICKSDGWGVELARFYVDGSSPLQCELDRESGGGMLPSKCATFYRKSWCITQPEYSFIAFVDQCIKPSEVISFGVALTNGRIPSKIDVPPALHVEGGSVTVSSSFSTSSLYPSLHKTCKGSLSCQASFVQDERFLDQERRYLPAFAVLRKATLSVDLACSSFSDPDQFLQRLSMCPVPDCVAKFGADYEWNQEQNECCSDVACIPTVCADPIPIPPGQLRAFDAGPWAGCQGNCSTSRVIMDQYDMIPFLCAGQGRCTKPKSFRLFMSATGAADKYACSGRGSNSVFVLAKVSLKLEVAWNSAAFASEPARLDSVIITQTTDAKEALSRFNVVVDSGVTFPINSVVTIAGMTGSITEDTTDQQEIFISHPACLFSSMLHKSIRVPCARPADAELISWNRKKGELQVKVLRTIASVGDNLQLSFGMRNPPNARSLRFPELTILLGDDRGLSLTRSSSTGVMSAREDPKFIDGNVIESTDIRRFLNRITVSFRLTYHLMAGDNATLYGLVNSETASTDKMTVYFDITPVMGYFNQEEGSMTVTLPRFWAPDETVVFSFSLQNPRNPQINRKIKLEVPSATPRADEKIIAELSSNGLKASENFDFSYAFLKQDHSIANQLNRLECSFAASIELPVGSTITVSGLIGSQTQSNIEFPIDIKESASATVSKKLAEWDSNRGTLSFALQSRIPAKAVFRFFFHLLNPKMKGPARTARLSVNAGSTQVAMCEVGMVLDASDSARFVIAQIGESSREASAQNTILMMLQLNIDLMPSLHEIHLSGMLLSTEVSLNVNTQDFGVEIPSGSQTLVLKPKDQLFHNQSYVFSWILRNPAQETVARDISIALHNTVTGVNDIAPTTVKGSVRTSSRTGNIVASSIQESTATLGAVNRLKVQFKVDFPLSYQTSITLTGLMSTLTSSGSLQIYGKDRELFREPSELLPKGFWDQATGTLSLSILQRTIVDAMSDIVVEFDLLNPAAARAENVVSLAIPAHIAQPMPFATKFLLATPSSFRTARVSESSGVAGMLNLITVSFSVNSELYENSEITITGLAGAELQTGSVEAAALESFSSGILVVKLNRFVPASTAVTIRFVLRNPQKIGAALTTNIRASTVVPSGDTIHFDEKKLEGTILAASEPMRFILTEVSESTRIQGDHNTLSITLQANCPLPSNTEITVTNLLGTQTQDTGCLTVTSPTGKINACGDWKRGSGTMIVAVGSLPFAAFESIEFSFVLTNAATNQDGVVPIVSASNGVRNAALIPQAVQWHDGVQAWGGDQAPDTVVGTVLSASDARVWTSGIVTETVKLTGFPNSIFIVMEANTDLPAGSKITITGLTGSSEPDTSSFMIEGQHGKDTTLGLWTKISGELAFALTRNIPQSEKLSFKLVLKNPPAPQTAVRPTISLSYCEDPTCSESWSIAPRQTVASSNGEVCCLSADDKPRFIMATVREMSNVKSALNVLQFWFRTNVPMTIGTKMTLSGLKSTETPDNNYLILMNSTSLSAKWRRGGFLEFQVKEKMYYCDCIDACDQNSISISVQLRNPKSEQPKPNVEVSLNREGEYIIEKTVVSGSVLRAQLDNALMASVSESSKVSGESNNITVQMIVNSDLDLCFAAWQPQSAAWISSDQTIDLYAAAEGETVAASLAKLFDGITDTSVSIAQDHRTSQTAELYFDFKQVFRLEAISVTGTLIRSSVKTLKLQFANSRDAPESEWDRNTATIMTIGSGVLAKTSEMFDDYAQYWRIQLVNNENPTLFPSSTSLSEIKFYGCPDSETATIKVSNLTEATRSVKLYNVKAGLGELRSYGNQVGDEVSIKVKTSIRAFQELSFTLESTNAPRAQPAKLASVSVEASFFQIPRTFALGSMLVSDEAAIFVTKTVTESNDLQSAYNTLEIVLRANVALNQGRHIRIAFGSKHLENNLDKNRAGALFLSPSCLDGKQHPCIKDNPLITDAAWYVGTDLKPLGYADQKPSFIVFLKATVPKFEEIRVNMLVKNPSQMQQAGLVPEVMASGIERSPMTGSILRATQQGPSFTTRIVHHSSDMVSGENTITVSLQTGPGVILAAGTIISICGLRGTDKDADTAAAFPKEKTFLSVSTDSSASGFRFSSTYQLTKESLLDAPKYTGELQACVIFVTEQGEWRSGIIESVSFSFKNPGILLESSDVPRLTVVANQKITIALPLCKVMNTRETNLCSVPSDALWTRREPGFLSVSLSQSNRAVGQPSTLSVQLVPNVVLEAGSKFTISGLHGFSANQIIEIKDVAGGNIPIAHLITVGSWAQSTGELELVATGQWNRANSPELRFQFTVTLPSSIQEDQNITLCPSFNVPDAGLADISGGALTLSSSSCHIPLGHLRVDQTVQFLVKRISESSDVENQDSIIELELASNFIILPGTILTLMGLTGSQTQDDESLAIVSYYGGDIKSEIALMWQQSAGVLKVKLDEKVPISPDHFKVTFVLQNPTRAAKDSKPTTPRLTVMNVGGTDFPAVLLDGAVLRSQSTARITSLKFHEQTRVKNQMNTLRVTFTSNVGISKGGRVTILGLVGRNQDQYHCISDGTDVNVTYSLAPLKITFVKSLGSPLEVYSTENSVVVNKQGCEQVDSTVQVFVPYFVKAGEDLSFHFRVANWPQQLAGCRPSVSYSGCRARLKPNGDLWCPSMMGGSSSCLMSDCTQDTTVIPQRSSDEIILSSRDTWKVWQSLVGESTPVLSQPNTITVTLTTNVELPAGASIIIKGFQNSQTENSLSLPIFGHSAAKFGEAGRWYANEGELKLTVSAQNFVDINQTLVFSFEIVNKGIQDRAQCSFGTHFCSGAGGYNEGKACPIEAEGQTCAGYCGQAKPYCSKNSLSGDCSGFSTQDLKDSVKVVQANAVCVGGVCFPPNSGYQCPADALVNTTANSKEAGQLIDPTVDKVRIVYMGQSQIIKGQACTGTDAVCQGQTVCLAPNEGAACTAHKQCTGAFDPSIEMAFFFKRAGNQRCVRMPRTAVMSVDVMATRANITSTRMLGNVVGLTSPKPAEFISRVLSETSMVVGASNVLTVSLSANFRLYEVERTNVTLIGIPLHRYGLGGRIPLLTANAQTKTQTVTCTSLSSIVTCDKIGLYIVTDDSNFVRTAFVTIYVECDSESVQILSLREGDGNQSVPVGSYSASPCLGYTSTQSPCIRINNGRPKCPLIENLDVRGKILENNGQGFKLRVFTNMQDAGNLTMRASLLYTETQEYGEYEDSTMTFVAAGRHAMSLRRDDRTLMLEIPLKNPPVAQVAPSVTVLGESGFVKRIGICDDEIEDGCPTANVPSTARTIMTGNVLTSAAESPIRYSSIQESSSVQGVGNILTVEVEIQTDDGQFVNIPAGSRITVSGLAGSQTPSTKELLVSGHRIDKLASWDQSQGVLVVSVNAMPCLPVPSSIRFSFELRNPSAAQAARTPWVMVSTSDTSYGGTSARASCSTRPGCAGVLAATEAPRFSSIRVFEKTRYAGHINTLSFFLEANVPLQKQGMKITLKLNLPPASGELALVRSPGTFRRAERCVGMHSCILRHDQTLVPGTILTRVYTDLQVACTDENPNSPNFGELWTDLEIKSLEIRVVRICGRTTPVNANYRNPCSPVVKHWFILRDFDVIPCPGDNNMLVQVVGRGLLNVTSVLNADYVFDTTSQLVYANQAFELTVVTNSSTPTFESTTSASQRLHQFAFSFNTTNPATRQSSMNPIVHAVSPEGLVLAEARANNLGEGGGIGGSGIVYWDGVGGAENQMKLPIQNAEVGVDGTNSLRLYHEIAHDGLAESISVIQPKNPNNFLMKLKFDSFDFNEDTEMVELFSGDSPTSPRMGILYLKTRSFRLDSRYFSVESEVIVEECAVALRFSGRRFVPPGHQQLLGYSRGRSGLAVSYDLVDPTKMDHFVAPLGFVGMVDDITETSIQLKLRKIFASILFSMYPSVIFEEASAGRRSIQDFATGRRAGTSRAEIRVLCNNPTDTTTKADAFSEALNTNLVSAAMNAAGIPGGVALTGPIRVYRCGVELECVPRPPKVVPPPVTESAKPQETPKPFPLERVIQLSLAVVLGPLIVVLVATVFSCHWKLKQIKALKAKKEVALVKFHDWMERKIQDLENMDIKDLGILAAKEHFVKSDWKDEEVKALIPDIALYFYRNKSGCGVQPVDWCKFVPQSLYQKGAKFNIKKPAQDAGIGKGPVKAIQTAEVTASLKFKGEESAEGNGTAEHDEAENGEGKQGIKNKKGKKRNVVREEHKVLWIKRAQKDKLDTQEEVAV